MASNKKIREAFLQSEDLAREKVSIEGMSEPMYVRRLRGDEVSKFLNLNERAKRGELTDIQLTASLIVLGACDESGESLFTDDDTKAILAKSYTTLETLSNAILKINKMDAEGKQEIKKT